MTTRKVLGKISFLFISLVILSFCPEVSVQALNLKEIPVNGQVNLIDLGADSCLPCKMMAPILTRLEKIYKGKAAVIFIDVWKFPDQAKRFGIRAIPTQIFYDKNGREIYRHEGFMSEKAIVAQLQKMGVN
ncbi:MAG: thioredoxin family protein [Thermodesulfobacteriota bacterium]